MQCSLFAGASPISASLVASPISELIITIYSALGLSEEWLAIVKSLAPMVASLIETRLPRAAGASPSFNSHQF